MDTAQAAMGIGFGGDAVNKFINPTSFSGRAALNFGSAAGEKILSGRAQDALTVAAGQTVADPQRPGFTRSGCELPSLNPLDPRTLAKMKQEAIGGAAGGVIFSGLQLVSPPQAGTAPASGVSGSAGASPAAGASILAQVAARGGRHDAPLSPSPISHPPFPRLETDLDSMPESGAEIVYDDDGSPMGWVPLSPSAISHLPSAISHSPSGRLLTPENDPVTAALAAQAAAMPEGLAASYPARPVNQPSAAADVPSADASVSAGVAPASTAFTAAATPAPQPDIRVAAGADALSAPLAPAATLAPVPQGVTSAANAPPTTDTTAPAANRQAAALPVSPDDTLHNASLPPIREGAENPPRVSMSRPAKSPGQRLNEFWRGYAQPETFRRGTASQAADLPGHPTMPDVPANAWGEGDAAFSGNVALLAEMEARAVIETARRRGVPIDRLRYDAATNTIQDDSGRSLRNRDVRDLLERLDSAASGIGEASFLRTLVAQNALQGHDVGPGAGLDDIHRHLGAGKSTADRSSGRLHESPDGLYRVLRGDRKLLYSKPAGNAAAGRVSAREAADGLSKLRAAAPALAQGVQIVPDRSSLNEADYHPKDWASFTGPDATEAFFNPRTGGVIILTDNLRRREGETPARAAARAIIHERIGHAGLAALRQMDATFEARWNKLMEALLKDRVVADEIASLHAQGYDHLSASQLVEEWFARQVEGMTPQQLQALKPTSTLGRLWQWLKDTLRKLSGRFSRPDWTAREIKEIMDLSRQALERGGPLGTQQDGRVLHAQVGETLRQADRTLIEEAPQSALLNTRASNEHIARAAAATLQAWPATVQAADGTGIDLQVADRGSLAARLWHLIRDEKTQKIDPDKAAWLPRVQETLQNAQLRLVDEQTGNRVYVRKYSGGIKHAIIIRPDGRVEAQQAFTGSLTTQFPLRPDQGRQWKMRIEWVRPDLDNGSGRRQNAPSPTPHDSMVSGPRRTEFHNETNPSQDQGQAPGRVMQSKRINPFHAGDAPNWLRSLLRIPANAPWRVQNLTLRSLLKGSPLPKELLPLFTPPCRGCGRRPRIA